MLKNQLEGEVEIHFLTKAKFSTLLDANPHLQFIHTFDKTVQEVLPALEKVNFDYIIDLHNNIRSAVVKRRLKSLAFTFDKQNFNKWLLVHLGIRRIPILHVVDRYLGAISAFKTKDDGQGLDYFIPIGKGLAEDQLPQTHQGKFIAIAIGGAHAGKRMSAEKWIQICKHIHYPIVLLGGKEDREVGNQILSASGNHVYNAVGDFTIHQSADCLQKSAFVVSGDTGLMHIASAFNKRIISIWGCTSPVLGMAAYNPNSENIIIEPVGLKKRPCSKLGNRCKYGKSNPCIERIDHLEIRNAIEMLWAR